MVLPPAGLPPLAMVASCVTQPFTKAVVVASDDAFTIGTDVDLAQLRKLSKDSPDLGKHPPYAFYLGDVLYSITAETELHDLCKGPITLRIVMRLTNRRIEVARDLKADPCQFPKVVAHYRHHAEADGAVFQRYVLKVATAVSHLQASSFADAYNSDEPVQGLVRVVKNVVEPLLQAMDAARASAKIAVDSPAEVDTLESGCSDHI